MEKNNAIKSKKKFSSFLISFSDKFFETTSNRQIFINGDLTENKTGSSIMLLKIPANILSKFLVLSFKKYQKKFVCDARLNCLQP